MMFGYLFGQVITCVTGLLVKCIQNCFWDEFSKLLIHILANCQIPIIYVAVICRVFSGTLWVTQCNAVLENISRLSRRLASHFKVPYVHIPCWFQTLSSNMGTMLFHLYHPFSTSKNRLKVHSSLFTHSVLLSDRNRLLVQTERQTWAMAGNVSRRSLSFSLSDYLDFFPFYPACSVPPPPVVVCIAAAGCRHSLSALSILVVPWRTSYVWMDRW